MISPHDGIFRHEALLAQRQRLEGRVIIAAEPSLHIFAAVVLVFSILVVAAFFLVPFADVKSIRGEVQTSQGLTRIVSPGTGTIEQIRINPGDGVRAGQTLALVNSDTADNRGVPKSTIEAKEIAIEIAALARKHEQDLADRDAETSRIKTSLRAAGKTKAALESQIVLLREKLNIDSTQVERFEALRERGLVTAVVLDESRSASLQTESQLIEQQKQLITIDEQLSSLSAQLHSKQAEYDLVQKDFALRQSELDSKRDDVLASFVYLIPSTTDGTVVSVPVSIGDIVSEGQAIATVRPSQSRARFVFLVDSSIAVGAQEGTRINIKLDEGPEQTATLLKTRVTFVEPVSAAQLDDRLSPGSFRIYAAVPDELLNESNASALPPGTQIAGHIYLGRRTAFQLFNSWQS